MAHYIAVKLRKPWIPEIYEDMIVAVVVSIISRLQRDSKPRPLRQRCSANWTLKTFHSNMFQSFYGLRWTKQIGLLSMYESS